MTIANWLAKAEKELYLAEIVSARLDSQLLASHVTNIGRAHLIASDAALSENQLAALDSMLNRRKLREPLAYITGSKEFMGLEFKVNSSVLIPRPETELMVETMVEKAVEGQKVLEIGTGSGAIAIALSDSRPDLILTATDISDEALEVASLNQKKLGTSVKFQKSDLFSNISGTYSIIAANLPYVPGGNERQPEITYEPKIALFQPGDGLGLYRKFFRQINERLGHNGSIIIEANPDQFSPLKEMAAENGFSLTALSDYVFWGQTLA